MWPNARISVMGGEQAAGVLVQVKVEQLHAAGKELSPAEADAIRQPVMEKYEREGNPYFSTARIWDDGIVDPMDTRQVVALGIAMASNTHVPDYRPGVYRM